MLYIFYTVSVIPSFVRRFFLCFSDLGNYVDKALYYGIPRQMLVEQST